MTVHYRHNDSQHSGHNSETNDDIKVEEQESRYGPYIEIETNRFTHSFALIDGIVVADPSVDDNVLAAIERRGYELSL